MAEENCYPFYMNDRLDSDVWENAMITKADIDALRAKYQAEIIEIAPATGIDGELIGNLDHPKAIFHGASSGTMRMAKAIVVEGRGLLESEGAERKNVVVVGQRLAGDLFPGESAVGKTIFMQMGETSTGFQIVGVYTQEDQRTDSYGGFMPVSAAQKILNQKVYGQLTVYPAPGQDIDVLSTRMVKFLESRQDAEGLEYYRVFSPEAALATINEVMGKVTLLIAAIACTLMKVPRVVSVDAILYASAFSIAIGLFFGIYPARRQNSVPLRPCAMNKKLKWGKRCHFRLTEVSYFDMVQVGVVEIGNQRVEEDILWNDIIIQFPEWSSPWAAMPWANRRKSKRSRCVRRSSL